MEANNILTSDLLDVVFEGRNKDYGAYELRRQYNTRLSVALLITCSLGVLIFLTSFLIKPKVVAAKPVISVVTLSDLDIPDQPLPPAEPAKLKPQPQFKTVTYVKPVVEPDEKVKQDQMLPEMDQLDDALIGTETHDGDKYDGTALKPAENTPNVVTPPVVDEANNIWERVEIDAEFPGGNSAWSTYISREINRNVDELLEDGRSGTVVVQFVVDKEGAVSEVSILPCNQTRLANCVGKETKLGEIAISAIRRGPKWKPAMQNGRNVKAFRRQPITFRLHEE
jgi:protein TonB